MTKRKFLSLELPQQHRKCAELLRLLYEKLRSNEEVNFGEYDALISWMRLLPFVYSDIKNLVERYHWHLRLAGLSLKEDRLLPFIRSQDRIPKENFPPIAIYLDHVRSPYNVGIILRTVEALRIGSVYFSEKTPFIDHEKVWRSSMGAAEIVPVFRAVPLSSLPRPIIVLETSEEAPSVEEFLFPKSFTLVLGNEECGVSEEVLKMTDYVVQVPLFGAKNALNVSSAFAIAAARIRFR